MSNKKPKVVCLVPAHINSNRFHAKALKDIEGLPMIVHTCKRAELAKSLDIVYLVTPNEEIKKVGEAYGLNVIKTKPGPTNATECAAQAAETIDGDIIVVLQGDEPLVYPEHIDAVVQPLLDDLSLQISIGVTSFTKRNSDSDIKAVLDLNNDVLYCSRNDIPWGVSENKSGVMLKLCFIVPYRKSLLEQYVKWKQTPLDLIEDNHFLRILENGVRMRAVMIEGSKISVDTQDDLDEIRVLMKADKLRSSYSKFT